MTLVTALPQSVQAQLEQAVRDAIAGVSQSDIAILHEIPPPDRGELALECAPEVVGISIWSPSNVRHVGVHVYCDDKPTGDVPLIPDELRDPAYPFPDHVDEREPTYLDELGGGYADLSEAMVRTLNAYCDVPDYEPARSYIDERVGLCCTTCYQQQVTFGTYVSYPRHVEDVYARGNRSLARHLGLPF